jgi:hypothetical protein
METLRSLLFSLAVLLLALAGMATIVGARSLRERLVRFAFATLAMSFLIPYAFASISAILQQNLNGAPSCGFSAPSSVAIPFLLGHLVLVVALLRRRLRNPERARREVGEVEHARMRERPRLPPGDEEEQS